MIIADRTKYLYFTIMVQRPTGLALFDSLTMDAKIITISIGCMIFPIVIAFHFHVSHSNYHLSIP